MGLIPKDRQLSLKHPSYIVIVYIPRDEAVECSKYSKKNYHPNIPTSVHQFNIQRSSQQYECDGVISRQTRFCECYIYHFWIGSNRKSFTLSHKLNYRHVHRNANARTRRSYKYWTHLYKLRCMQVLVILQVHAFPAL